MSWLDQLQAQPWYPSVAQAFAQYAPDVPPAIWQATIASETGSNLAGAPSAIGDGTNGNPPAYGIFQEQTAFPTRVGLPAATAQQLSDPSYNATIAALAMERAIKNLQAITPTPTLSQMLQAVERAGWNGSLSEDPARQANLANVVAQGAQTTGGGGLPNNASGDPALGSSGGAPVNASGDPALNSKPSNNAPSSTNPPTSFWTGLLQTASFELLVGGIIVAVLSGGFLLLANAAKGDA